LAQQSTAKQDMHSENLGKSVNAERREGELDGVNACEKRRERGGERQREREAEREESTQQTHTEAEERHTSVV
jgi:hypothetical protein